MLSYGTLSVEIMIFVLTRGDLSPDCDSIFRRNTFVLFFKKSSQMIQIYLSIFMLISDLPKQIFNLFWAEHPSRRRRASGDRRAVRLINRACAVYKQFKYVKHIWIGFCQLCWPQRSCVKILLCSFIPPHTGMKPIPLRLSEMPSKYGDFRLICWRLRCGKWTKLSLLQFSSRR